MSKADNAMDEEVIYGIHAVRAVLAERPKHVFMLWVEAERGDRRIQALCEEAQAAGISLRRVPRAKLDQLAEGERHQGAVIRCQARPLLGENELMGHLDAVRESPFVLVLDGVQDPHNLGACLRSAEAAGVDAVVVPHAHTAPLTATVRRAASGAAETVPLFRVKNLARSLDKLKERGLWIVGLSDDGEKELFALDLRGPLVLVLGAEGAGMRRLTREACDFLARIPMHGSVSSLNLSVATGVTLFEAVRQRGAADAGPQGETAG